jgi:hypothetical protein
MNLIKDNWTKEDYNEFLDEEISADFDLMSSIG